jgi:uncharacterized OB-fold protein
MAQDGAKEGQVTTDSMVMPKPGNGAIRLGADGSPRIEAFRCAACGAVFADRTLACRACASRTAPEPFRAAETGRLHTWSVVHRSYPGVAVPFVSAIVDLDGGPALKGTVRQVDPATVRKGMALRLVFDDAGGARDKDGVPYVGFHFIPAQGDGE